MVFLVEKEGKKECLIIVVFILNYFLYVFINCKYVCLYIEIGIR